MAGQMGGPEPASWCFAALYGFGATTDLSTWWPAATSKVPPQDAIESHAARHTGES